MFEYEILILKKNLAPNFGLASHISFFEIQTIILNFERIPVKKNTLRQCNNVFFFEETSTKFE